MSPLTLNALLQTKDLSVGYRDKTQYPLFEKLNLSLYPGQLVCFMGPNGVGKSTLIRTLAGLQKPLQGEKYLLTQSAGKTHTAEHIAIVLTDRITAANMTVYELVTFGRYPYLSWDIELSAKDQRIVNDAITQVRIQHLVDKKLYELSDGQLQLTMIARALCQHTEIILLDEPTAHLDLNNRVDIMKILRDLTRSTGKAILIATHDLDLALQTADVIWLAGRDKNIISGLPEDLVLNGTFDDIFQFKGFDLRTGKILHHISRPASIFLKGEGYGYLWTKNALERNGFEVKRNDGDRSVTVSQEDNKFIWVVDNKVKLNSLQEVITFLQQAVLL